MATEVPEGYEVTIPGWEDVIHIIPDRARELEELVEINRQRAERIARSPTPEAVQQVREILTWIDDVQDALVTLSLITRVLIKYTGKTIPGARWLASGADLLNLGTSLDVLNQGFPADKRGARDLMRRQPRSYRARLLRTQRAGAINATLGELLQVLQTTDTLLGVGISLGALMSAPIDALFLATTGGDLVIPLPPLDITDDFTYNLAQAASGPFFTEYLAIRRLIEGPAFTGGDITIPIPKLLPTIWEPLDLFPDLIGSSATTAAIDAAETALEGAAFLQNEGQTLSFDDHVATLAAQHMALQVLGNLHAFRDWTPYAKLKANVPIPRHLEAPPRIREAMVSVGLNPNTPGKLALPGAPEEATWGTVLQTVPRAASAALPHWLSQATTPDQALFAAHLQWEVANQYLWAIEGPTTRKEETLTNEALAVELMLNAELPPGIWQNTPARDALHRALTDTLQITASKRIDPDTFERAARAALAAHPLP